MECMGGLLPPWCSSPSLHPWVRCSPSPPGSQLSSPSDCLCICRRGDSSPWSLSRKASLYGICWAHRDP